MSPENKLNKSLPLTTLFTFAHSNSSIKGAMSSEGTHSLTHSHSSTPSISKLEKKKMAQAMLKSSLQGEIEADIEIKAPATKFYHMFAVRPQDVSKATPENVQRCDVNEGETGRVGTLLTWNYVHGKQNFISISINLLEDRRFDW